MQKFATQFKKGSQPISKGVNVGKQFIMFDYKGIQKVIALKDSDAKQTDDYTTVNIKVLEKGDKFTALRNSSRTWEVGMAGYKAENQGNPIYLEGDEVAVTDDIFQFDGFTAGTETKVGILKKLGITPEVLAKAVLQS